MQVLTDADSAVRLEDIGTAARPHRHSHRRARGEVQGTGERHTGGELGGNTRTCSWRAPGSIGAVPGRADLFQCSDVSEVDSKVLRYRFNFEGAIGERDHPAGTIGSCLRSHLASKPNACGSAGGG